MTVSLKDRRMRLFWIIIIVAALQLAPADSRASERRVKLYGFFDLVVEGNDAGNPGEFWSFDQHHFNIISVYTIDDNFRVCAEVEWEHGPSHSATDVQGKIYLAKAYLQYKYNDALRFRAGKFLTPFGIYNERHDATPSFVFISLPKAVYGKHPMATNSMDRMYGKIATGLQIAGRLFKGDHDLSYAAYIGNGRGPEMSSADNNANKAVGGRARLSLFSDRLKIGSSFFAEKNGQDANSRQTNLGFDIAFQANNVFLEAEMVLPRIERVDTQNIPNGRYRNSTGFYVQAGYTFFDNLTPVARYEWFRLDNTLKNETEVRIAGGLNYSVTPQVVLKAELLYDDLGGADPSSFRTYLAQVAVAF